MDDLEPKQARLLIELVEHGHTLPREHRGWVHVRTAASVDVFKGARRAWEVVRGDLLALQEAGYLRNVGGQRWDLTAKAQQFYEDQMQEEPTLSMEEQSQRLISDAGFRSRYPNAYARWCSAQRLLSARESGDNATLVGHSAREATQAFATELVAQHQPHSVCADETMVEKRVGAVIAMHAAALGEKRRLALQALGSLWRATNGLIQRQEHGAAKEGESVTADDARRIVLLTLVLMTELDQALAHLSDRSEDA